jgi:hypothetical protein
MSMHEREWLLARERRELALDWFTKTPAWEGDRDLSLDGRVRLIRFSLVMAARWLISPNRGAAIRRGTNYGGYALRKISSGAGSCTLGEEGFGLGSVGGWQSRASLR